MTSRSKETIKNSNMAILRDVVGLVHTNRSSLSRLHSYSAYLLCPPLLSLASLAYGDTLVLRDGTSVSGSLVKANPRTIEFQDEVGSLHIFETSQIEVLRMTSDGKNVTESPSLPPLIKNSLKDAPG